MVCVCVFVSDFFFLLFSVSDSLSSFYTDARSRPGIPTINCISKGGPRCTNDVSHDPDALRSLLIISTCVPLLRRPGFPHRATQHGKGQWGQRDRRPHEAPPSPDLQLSPHTEAAPQRNTKSLEERKFRNTQCLWWTWMFVYSFYTCKPAACHWMSSSSVFFLNTDSLYSDLSIKSNLMHKSEIDV